jgi:glutamine synthetase adenylyltransferase
VHVEKRTDRDGIVLYMNELISRVKKEKLASKSNSEDWEYFKDQFQEESQEIRKLNPQLFDNDNDLKDLESQLHTLFNS